MHAGRSSDCELESVVKGEVKSSDYIAWSKFDSIIFLFVDFISDVKCSFEHEVQLQRLVKLFSYDLVCEKESGL